MRLGLDIGTTSIGWGLIHNNVIVAAGTHIFPVGVNESDYAQSGKEISKNIQRRIYRMTRRTNYRFKLRRQLLQEYLTKNSFPSPSDIKSAKDLYLLRKKAIYEKVTLEELVRLWFLLNKRRGFKSSRKTQIDEDKETSELKIEANNISKLVKENNHQTVGAYFASLFEKGDISHPNDEQPQKRIRQIHINRTDYINVFNQIWEKQSQYYTILNKEHLLNIRDKIIYYQRKLKPAKNLINDCKFEKNKKCIAISHPAYQEFRLWQNINNIRYSLPSQNIYDCELNQEDKTTIAKYLESSTELKRSYLEKLLGKKRSEIEFNDVLDAVKGNTTLLKIKKATKEEPSYDETLKIWQALEFFEDDENLLNHLQNKLGYTEEQSRALSRISLEQGHGNLSHKAIATSKVNKETGEIYHGILYYLKQGLSYDKACLAAGYKFNTIANDTEDLHELENDINKINLDYLKGKGILIPNSPLIKKVLSESIRVIKNICKDYGRPEEIRIELARTLRKPKEKREEERESNKNKEKIRKSYRTFLESKGFHNINKSLMEKFELWLELECVSKELEERLPEAHQNIQRFIGQLPRLAEKGYEKLKLWLECKRISVYTGKVISLSELLDENGSIEIEHIIPYSFSQDDSFANKTICERDINKEKGARGALEYIESLGPEHLSAFKKRVLNITNKSKQRRLLLNLNFSKLSPDKLTKEQIEILNQFRPDAIAATAHASRKLVEILRFISPKVYVSSGSVTSMLRNEWGLNNILSLNSYQKARLQELKQKITLTESETNELQEIENQIIKNRNDHRHHALDAIIIAFTTQSMVQKLNSEGAKGYQKERSRLGSVRIFSRIEPPMPIDDFRASLQKTLDEILVSYRNDNKITTTRINQYKWVKGDKKKILIEKQKNGSIKKTLSPRGSLHNDFLYGEITDPNYGDTVKVITRPLSHFRKSSQKKNHDKDFLKIVDPVIRQLIETEYNKNKEVGIVFNQEERHYNVFLPVKKDALKRVPILSVRMRTSLPPTKSIDAKKFTPDMIDLVLNSEIKELIIKNNFNLFNPSTKSYTVIYKEKPLNKIQLLSIKNPSQAQESDKDESEGGAFFKIDRGFVRSGDNRYLAIYQNESGVYLEKIITFMEAYMNIKNKKPAVPGTLDENKEKLLMIIEKMDLVLLGCPLKDNEIIDPKFGSIVSKYLFRVKQLAAGNYQFVHHLVSARSENIGELKKAELYFQLSINTFTDKNPIKIKLSPTGRVIEILERIC